MKRLTGTIATILALLALAAATPPAGAHQGDPNFRSEITSIDPSAMADGIQMTVKNFDDSIEMVNRSGRTVVVLGYNGEPYVRFSPDGTVEVNLNSPSRYLNEERYADIKVPERADAKAAPEWQKVDDSGVYLWHDHRSHYMAADVPLQVTDESVETKIFDYRIPLTVNGRPADARGTLTWVGTDDATPVAPFIGLGLLVVAGIAFVFVRRHRTGS